MSCLQTMARVAASPGYDLELGTLVAMGTATWWCVLSSRLVLWSACYLASKWVSQ